MKALVAERAGGPEVLAVQEVPPPQPKNGEVLVNVEAVGLNFADLLGLSGNYPGLPKPPYIPGREFSGTIAATGERVMGYSEYGAFAQQIAAERHRLWPAPHKFTAAEAAAFPVNFFTAYLAYWQAGLIGVENADVRFPDGRRPRVLIHAVAGGVGTAAVQIGKALGIEMYGTSSSDAKLQGAFALGLDHGINYSRQDYEQVIREHTHKEGVDAVFDMLGGLDTAKSIRSLAFLGRVVLYGTASGKKPEFNPQELYSRSTAVVGLWLSRLSARKEIMEPMLRRLHEWINQGRLRPAIGHRLSLAEAAEGFRMLAERKNFGKVVVSL